MALTTIQLKVTEGEGYRVFMWHVFIQWLAHRDLLDEWLELSVAYIYRGETDSVLYQQYLPTTHPINLPRLFPLTESFFSEYETYSHKEWRVISAAWEEFYIGRESLFVNNFLIHQPSPEVTP